MQIQIGHVACDPRLLDKSGLFLGSSPRPVNAQIWKNCSIKSPDFLLDISPYEIHANYAYVPEWQAYYFLSEPVVMDGIRCSVSGTLDPLTTYAAPIRALSGYLIRTADGDHANVLIRDNRYPAQSNRQMQIYEFDASPFTANYASDLVYLLTVVGGDHS